MASTTLQCLSSGRSSYWSEPRPLKRSYPSQGDGGIEFTMQIIGFLLLMATMSIPGPGFPGPGWLLIALMLGGFGIAALFFYASTHVGDWERGRMWKKAFMANNNDLGLKWSLIKKTSKWMSANTGFAYYVVEPYDTAANIALAMREKDPEGLRSALSLEVLGVYQYLAGQRAEPPVLRYPKHKQ